MKKFRFWQIKPVFHFTSLLNEFRSASCYWGLGFFPSLHSRVLTFVAPVTNYVQDHTDVHKCFWDHSIISTLKFFFGFFKNAFRRHGHSYCFLASSTAYRDFTRFLKYLNLIKHKFFTILSIQSCIVLKPSLYLISKDSVSWGCFIPTHVTNINIISCEMFYKLLFPPGIFQSCFAPTSAFQTCD